MRYTNTRQTKWETRVLGNALQISLIFLLLIIIWMNVKHTLNSLAFVFLLLFLLLQRKKEPSQLLLLLMLMLLFHVFSLCLVNEWASQPMSYVKLIKFILFLCPCDCDLRARRLLTCQHLIVCRAKPLKSRILRIAVSLEL